VCYRRGGQGVTSTVVRAYRFAVDPAPAQEAVLRSDCGAQRFAFNWGLALVKANLGQRHAETFSGIRAGELTPAVPWSAYSLRKRWNQAKDENAPWWGENSTEACFPRVW
jgi:putative transposase